MDSLVVYHLSQNSIVNLLLIFSILILLTFKLTGTSFPFCFAAIFLSNYCDFNFILLSVPAYLNIFKNFHNFCLPFLFFINLNYNPNNINYYWNKKEAQEAYAHTNQFMNEIILSSALLRWGIKPPVKEIRYSKSLESLIEENYFAFFIANLGSFLPNPWKQWTCGIPVERFYHVCDAYNNLLVLEYLALKKKYNF